MIVKNEAHQLSRCLASARPYVEEIIVVDTGSSDETVAIAHQFGAQVSYFEWCDDFAQARNASLAHATGDWILVLDADEELVVQSRDFWQTLTTNSQIWIYNLKRTEANLSGDRPPITPLYPSRLFRNLPELRYVFPFHEQLHYQGQPLPGQQVAYLSELELRHYGYADDTLHQKHLHRNIPLLERVRQRDGLNLMLLATLANFYQKAEQPEQAQGCYTEAYDRLLPHLMEGIPPAEVIFVPYLLHTLGTQAFEQADLETVRLICQRGLEWFPNFPPLNYLAASLLNELGFARGAIAYLDYCLQMGRDSHYYKGEPFDLGFVTTYPAHTLGCIYTMLNQWQAADNAFKMALSFNPEFGPAREGLEQIKANAGFVS
jgi:tetratricopeptide (TPR) repeat protein